MDLITPLPLPAECLPLAHALHKRLVEELERRGRTAVIVLAPVLIALWELQRQAAEQARGIRWIFVLLALTMVFRLAIRLKRDGSPGQKHFRFTVLSTLTGLLLGAMVLTSFPHLSPTEKGLMGMVMAGINAAAMVSMAPSLTTYLLYCVPMVGSLVAASIAFPIPDHPHVFQAFAWLYLIGLTGLSVQVHEGLRQEILSRMQMEESALRDPLTGLHNRRFLGEFMHSETSQTLRAWRQPESLHATVLLMMVDLDHFKSVNDLYGHAAGDAVLVQFSALLREVVRKPDLVVRWGGEEFLIVARHTVRELPIGLSERLRSRVGQHEFVLPDGSVIHCTCSLGFALYPFLPDQPERLSWEQCVALADAGLYQAKAEGRDRWVGLEAGPTAWAAIEATFRISEHEPQAAEASGFIRVVRDPGRA
ncbi:MAG TPA: GGDEF domain-containing protein [Holophagaceae bacterium]|nr:GGDEF domain-containing protein [Holophagaceae bacterium]